MFLLDVSQSMDGHLARCAVETLLCFISALLRLEIDNFSILFFGETVHIMKTESQNWSSDCILTLLSHLLFDQNATLDGEALACGLDLILSSSVRGPKKVFVLSDGVGSAGLRLAQNLKRAQDAGVEVIGLGVGCDELFIDSAFPVWLKAALPSSVPDALAALYQMDDEPNSEASWDTSVLVNSAGSTKTTDEILEEFESQSPVFDGLKQQLISERETKLIADVPSTVTLDICFCIDVTGSMGPWIATAKQHISIIITEIENEIKREYPSIEFKMRFAVVAYRDIDDTRRFEKAEFTSDKKAIATFVQNLQAQGGGDVPEDALGALHMACHELKWESRARFLVLITDAPGHGHELNDDKNDKFPHGDPNRPLSTSNVIQSVIANNIDLMLCRIKRRATLKMERRFCKLYNDATQSRKLTTVDLFDDTKVEASGSFHIVFCLDESGSMRGGRWASLQQAYQTFLSHRSNGQGGSDIVSVIQFDSSARVMFERQHLDVARSASLSMRGGGTNFAPALDTASSVLQNARQLGYTPMLVFMSDGHDDGGSSALTRMGQIYRTHASEGLQVYCIPFQAGRTGEARLAELARCGGGQVRSAASESELVRVFASIAQGCTAMDGLVSAFGEKISNMVVKKLLLDFY
jgi:Mg-chelatase subunit ChlD